MTEGRRYVHPNLHARQGSKAIVFKDELCVDLRIAFAFCGGFPALVINT